METNLVFVYGTLKEGFGNNRLLSSSLLVGSRTTTDKGVLLASGVPFFMPSIAVPYDLSDLCAPIRGELWEIPEDDGTLEALDHLESEGSFYHRRLITTTAGELCWTYVILDPTYFNYVTCATMNSQGEWQWP